MLTSILSSIICKQFEREFPDRFEGRNNPPRAMLLSFDIPIDYDREEGYRHIDLAIYAHCNYVLVAERVRWDVRPIDGDDYTKGDDGWIRLSYHDSCWRTDGVNDFIFTRRDDLLSIEQIGQSGGWYNIVPVKSLDEGMFKSLIEKRL